MLTFWHHPKRPVILGGILGWVLGVTLAAGAGADFGTLRDRHGAVMRGTPMVLGRSLPAAVSFAEDAANWSELKSRGFNTVRICWVDPWYFDHGYPHWSVAEVLPHLDVCVQRAREAGLNLIINYHNVGEQQEKVDFILLREFWQAVAPRYREDAHVYYELSNEPSFNGNTYRLPTFKTGILEIYDQVRRDAPQREVLMFSFNSLEHDMVGIVAEYAADLDWSHTSVAFHLYTGRGGEVTSAKVQELMQSYRVICTEWDYPGRWDYVPVVDGFAVNSQTLENLGVSWVDWHDWGDVEFGQLFSTGVADAKTRGYWWGDYLEAPEPGALINLSARANAGAGEQALIAGYVTVGQSGTNFPVLVRGIGPMLREAPFNLPAAMADPQLTMYRAQTVVGTNDDWGGGRNFREQFAALGGFPLSDNSRDAALLRQSAGPEAVTVHVDPATGGAGVVLAELYDASSAPGTATNPIHLSNISVRAEVGQGAALLVGGFVINGNVPRRILIRGIGPTLGEAPFNLTGVLADPVLRLFRADGTFIQGNDDWGGGAALQKAFGQVGAFALANSMSRDAALDVTLAPGVYTVQLSGRDDGGGLGLIEIYDLR